MLKIRMDGNLAPFAIFLFLSACSTTLPVEKNAAAQNAVTTDVAQINRPAVEAPAAAPPNIDRHAPNNIRSEQKLSKRYISFAPNEQTIDQENRTKLQGYAQELKNHPKSIVVIKAFSDSSGSRAYTLAALEKQLHAVSATLQEFGIHKSRIRQVLMGQRIQKKFCGIQACRNGGQMVEIDWKE